MPLWSSRWSQIRAQSLKGNKEKGRSPSLFWTWRKKKLFFAQVQNCQWSLSLLLPRRLEQKVFFPMRELQSGAPHFLGLWAIFSPPSFSGQQSAPGLLVPVRKSPFTTRKSAKFSPAAPCINQSSTLCTPYVYTVLERDLDLAKNVTQSHQGEGTRHWKAWEGLARCCSAVQQPKKNVCSSSSNKKKERTVNSTPSNFDKS